METSGGRVLGILGRLGDKILTVLAVALVGLGAYALYRMGPGGRAALWDGLWRSAVWLAIAAVVPWTARLFIRRVLAVGSNWAGLTLIAGYCLLDVLAGWLLLTGWPQSGWGWTAALAGLALACTYNYLVTEYVAEQAGG